MKYVLVYFLVGFISMSAIYVCIVREDQKHLDEDSFGLVAVTFYLWPAVLFAALVYAYFSLLRKLATPKPPEPIPDEIQQAHRELEKYLDENN